MKGTDRSTTGVRVVLCSPSSAGNVGAVARAMDTMGARDLVLVTPWGDPSSPEALTRAAGSEAILRAARVVDSLGEALQDRTLVLGASARPRRLGSESLDARRAAERIVAAAGERVALVFGTERGGLTNEELARCHQRLFIPTAGPRSSLNLAAAVQVVLYELHMARAGAGALPGGDRPAEPPASAARVERLLGALMTSWEATGFVDPSNPAHAVSARRLQAFYRRARPDEQEVRLLLTAARRSLQASGRRAEEEGADG